MPRVQGPGSVTQFMWVGGRATFVKQLRLLLLVSYMYKCSPGYTSMQTQK